MQDSAWDRCRTACSQMQTHMTEMRERMQSMHSAQCIPAMGSSMAMDFRQHDVLERREVSCVWVPA